MIKYNKNYLLTKSLDDMDTAIWYKLAVRKVRKALKANKEIIFSLTDASKHWAFLNITIDGITERLTKRKLRINNLSYWLISPFGE